MNMSVARWPFLLAGISGALAIALGAFGAHGLAPLLAETGRTEIWKTAALYHLIHVVALFGGAILHALAPASAPIFWALASWAVGTFLFSGSLYFLALGAPGWFGAITPLGGLMFIAGWIFICFIRRNPVSAPVSDPNIPRPGH